MKDIDEIIYDALTADTDLTAATSGRIMSTAIEVSPDETDTTPLPYLIVTYDGMQNQQPTKDDQWEASEDQSRATVEIAAESPREVHRLTRLARRAIARHIATLAGSGQHTPWLDSLTSNGIAWDWTKPCYYQQLTYTVTTTVNID